MWISELETLFETNPLQRLSESFVGGVAHPIFEWGRVFFALCDSSGCVQVEVPPNLPNFQDIKDLQEYDQIKVTPVGFLMGSERLTIDAKEIEILNKVSKQSKG